MNMNQRIYNYSIHLLARQDYSTYKLKRKLLSKKDNLPHEVDEVIAILKSKGLIPEDNYRRLFIRKWMIKGESKNKIIKRGSMERLEFSAEEFTQVEQELGFCDDESIEKLVIKKLRSKEIPKNPIERQKLQDKVLRFLISKGHSFSEARKSIQRYLEPVDQNIQF